MAAAMMQHQLTNVVKQQHPQPQQQIPSTANPINIVDYQLKHQNSSRLMVDQEIQLGGQAQPQRINYCTICNKELCNKYFMKTHMLKMHGINLEMEHSDGNESNAADEQDHNSETVEEGGEKDGGCGDREEGDHSEESSSCSPTSKNNNTKDRSIKCAKASNSSNSSSKRVKPSSSSSSTSGGSGCKSTTSVMNGFAGNSMGGVVCDICNKELCSKYFLKVHKQNTHGITTDYQDANQFMYPFPGSLSAPNPFLTPAAILPTLAGSSSFQATPPPPNPLTMFGATGPRQNQYEEPIVSKKSGGAKRTRLSQAKQQTSPSNLSLGGTIEKGSVVGLSEQTSNGDPSKQFEDAYRLILAQQQQHHQTLPSANATQPPPPPPLMSLNPLAANPLGALMCYGAMGPVGGPFGAAGMSPAMIVDNILRNQHLFNRNTGGQPAAQAANANITDRNNNTNNNDSKQGSKNSKDSPNNSRYFSHYTEACPMCDRRFKSIKWLKTHMMNDHKQEIGAYMQMMVQYLYTSKSQQMAAAATMAAIEQQQQHQIHQQQQQQYHHLHQHQQQPSYTQHLESHQTHQYQQQHPASLLGKCFNPADFQQPKQSQQHTTTIINQDRFNNSKQSCYSKRVMSPPGHEELINVEQAPGGGDYVIDARCKHESLSPGESMNRQDSSPSSHLDFENDNNHHQNLIYGLNFELGKLADRQKESNSSFFRSQGSPDIGSDIVEEDDDENSADSDRLATISQQDVGETAKEDRPSQQQQNTIKTTKAGG